MTADPVEAKRRDPQAPKGRPTPKRSEAQARRPRPAATGDRKAAAKQAREARRIEMAKQREALASGDERYLPVRDKGPVRRFCRDYVDARYHVAELFLPLAVVILVISMVPNMRVKDVSLLLWLVLIVLIVGQSLFTGLRLRSLLADRFPKENKRGAVAYALMRSLQMRRMRLPKPQVKRGERG
ncbi:putative integral membrane protein [Streptantibioticus cattleyicolor NRRL 8057 = DSM 46488]|nr:putative integral membrane protein [Streptantibioticus cattleyicolor NRRL 8057 = DSM 46488]